MCLSTDIYSLEKNSPLFISYETAKAEYYNSIRLGHPTMTESEIEKISWLRDKEYLKYIEENELRGELLYTKAQWRILFNVLDNRRHIRHASMY